MGGINKPNSALYNQFYEQHETEGGEYPHATAITNLIADSIKKKNFLIYKNGGRDIDYKDIDIFDVVCHFTITNDAIFMVCMDNKDEDSCIFHTVQIGTHTIVNYNF